MQYKLIYHPDILKYDLPKIPQNIKKSIKRAIEQRLLKEPVSAGKPLRQSLKGHRKLRIGDYRVIYRLEGKEIIILKIDHRKEVYTKVFPRMQLFEKLRKEEKKAISFEEYLRRRKKRQA